MVIMFVRSLAREFLLHYARYERMIAWNDPDLEIAWNLKEAPIISTKDRLGKSLIEAEVFR